MEPSAHDLLVISDLHLGEGLGLPKSLHTLRLEDALIAFLDHHRAQRRRWRLVVNGDMIEMSALAIPPASVGLEGQHPHEVEYGLGARADAAVLKLALIVEHHTAVFDAFARFLADGNLVSVVIGNHDIELYWPAVQTAFTDALVRRAVGQGSAPEVVRAGFSFHAWFFFEKDLAWIEHGHQYDPYCSFEEALEPATDAQEIDPNLGGLLPRYIGPRMGASLDQAFKLGFFGYLAFWFAQGGSQLAGIVQAYFSVCGRMIEHWRARVPTRLEARRRRARMRLRRLAHRLKLPEELLTELKGFATSPVSVDLWRIVQALMLDRLALLLVGPALVLAPLLLPWHWVGYGALLAAMLVLPWLWVATVAREPTDPSDSMRAVARRIRHRMRVPFVVMGHSHKAVYEVDGVGAYVNSGHWVPSDLERAFTHVRIERTATGGTAVLCQWRDGVSRVYDALRRTPSPEAP